ncbi:MAG: DEAD/DEAH box helicase [Bacteroidetes bacterium]|nr:DEAD/DEAH box helicase [Bacteroidota bacterium]
MTFENLNLMKSLLDSVKKEGYLNPTSIQQQSIPYILNGKDLFGCAQTGTGKTAAFALPILQKIALEKGTSSNGSIKALVLAPTRELAIQIDESFRTYGALTGLKNTCVYGGVSQHTQVNKLRRGVDILIATPGRLLDLIQQRIISLDTIRYFVLDEADRMLDMGFINDIKKVVAMLPAKRQTLCFAATITPDIRKLAGSILRDPVSVSVAPESSVTGLITQSVYYVKKEDKRYLLKHVMQDDTIEHALVFTRTKHGADKVARDLNKNGIRAEAIHGDKSQNNRERSLKGFKNGLIRVLVATDVVSRGIDIESLSHVINYEIPETPETYVHRIGRTGRAGVKGTAMSFCSVDEKPYLKDIHKVLHKEINVVKTHPFSSQTFTN